MPWQSSHGSGLYLHFPDPKSHTSKDFTWGLHLSPSPVALLIACPHHVPTLRCFTDKKAKNGYHRQGAMIETCHQAPWTGKLDCYWHGGVRNVALPQLLGVGLACPQEFSAQGCLLLPLCSQPLTFTRLGPMEHSFPLFFTNSPIL